MASYHCTVKAGASSSASAHADYIERDGKYKTKDREDLEAVESGNMPEWAERSGDFWEASDQHERANAKGYREYEVALPREMTQEQRLDLVREFVRQELGDRHAYTFAIHNPRAALEGGEQPHAHIMFSERNRDGIERSREQYFKRYNAKNPERGGCRKGDGAKTPTERKADLVALRERWAILQNRHLEKNGHTDRVDHRSLEAQGIDRLPTEHMGPKAAAMEQRGQATRRGQARTQRRADIAELATIPDLARRIQADRDELGKLETQNDQVKDLVELEKQAGQVVADWRRLVQVERAGHLQELTANAHQATTTHSAQLEAHQAAEPKLFGRKEWEAQRATMEDRGHQLLVAYSALKEGRYPSVEKEKQAVEKAALQRATAKQPRLAAALAPAEAVLRAKVQRERVERERSQAGKGLEPGKGQER